MTHKLLIVEDETSILVPLRFLMEQNGFTVIAVESGEAALAALTDFQPDLILLDIMLPGMDGFEVCQRVRSNPAFRHVKIVMLSAKGGDIDVTKGLAVGADDYIPKPFSNKEVVRRVREMLAP